VVEISDDFTEAIKAQESSLYLPKLFNLADLYPLYLRTIYLPSFT
jgi:hypothetical protein